MYKDGDTIILEKMSGETITEIPTGNWLVKFNPDRGIFFLEKMKDFTYPSKVYGVVQAYADRYNKSFKTWDGNLGILLTGLKGTGKSLLAKKVCIDSGYPVIIIQTPFCCADFKDFISRINQPIVMFFDEFEKVYFEQHKQQAMLSLMDGAFSNKIMFMLTVNDQSKVVNYMMNRPGRIHYSRAYESIEMDVISAICEDLLDDKSRAEQVKSVCTYVGEVSMDIVLSIIREMNLYPDDDAMAIIGQMNIKPSSNRYTATVFCNDIKIGDGIHTWDNPIVDTEVDLDWYGADRFTLVGKTKDTTSDAEDAVIDFDGKVPDSPAVTRLPVKTWNSLQFDYNEDTKTEIRGETIVVEHTVIETKERYVIVYKREKVKIRNYF